MARQAWCRVCLTDYQRDRRARGRGESGGPDGGGGRGRGGRAGRGGASPAQSEAACPTCVTRAKAVRDLFAAFVQDAAVRQAIGRLPWGGFRERVLAALSETPKSDG